MKNSNSNKYIKTPEFPLAVTFLCLGFKLEGIEKDFKNPSRRIFLFAFEEKLSDTISAYWKDELRVEPKAFYNASRELKSRLRAEEIYQT